MRALVTGASGFLGSHIVEGLITQGFEVFCLVRSGYQFDKIVNLGGRPIYGDLRLLESICRACKGMDYIFHAAAKVDDWGPWSDYYFNTVLGTSNIVDAAVYAGVAKIIHVSTVDVYDKSLFQPGQPKISEDFSLTTDDDSHFYARAKLFAEKIVTSEDRINYSIIRPATIYGPRDLTILPRVIEFLESQIAFFVKGFDPVLGLVHVKDVANLCIAAAMSDISNGKAYNASTEDDIKLREYVSVVCSCANIIHPKLEIPCSFLKAIVLLSEGYSRLFGCKQEPLFTRGALGFFIDDQRFEISRAKEDLGWNPKIKTIDGIKDSVKDFLSNRGL